MDWVEGQTFRQFVADRLTEPYILRRLFDLWLKVERWLESADLAHGDLQHANLIMVADERRSFVELKLVDYDGMWAPGLSEHPSHECGHPAYQHPCRERDDVYDPCIDRFPNLVIASALRCLGRPEGLSLWQRYDNGDNLLFSRADFAEPENSPLLRELWDSGNPEIQCWVVHLVIAAQAPPEGTPALRELLVDGRLQLPAQESCNRVASLLGRANLLPAVANSGAKLVVEFATLEGDDGSPKQAIESDDLQFVSNLVAPAPHRTPGSRSNGRHGKNRWLWRICGIIALALLVGIGGIRRSRNSAARTAAVAKHLSPQDRALQQADPDQKKLARDRPASPVDSPREISEPTDGSPPTTPTDPFAGTAPGQERDDNLLNLKLVWCPPGKSVMGRRDNAGPADSIEPIPTPAAPTQGFWLGKFEVTQGQWTRLMDTQPWRDSDDVRMGEQYPAVLVRWAAAAEFCIRLTHEERQAGRLPPEWMYLLPTESQWECGCRAGTKSQYCFGDDPTRLGDYAWYVDNTFHSNEPFAHEAGQKRPNTWGLHDMHGNVGELCRLEISTHNSGRGDADVGHAGSTVVARGGSYDDSAESCRSASGRDAYLPNAALGFRVGLAHGPKAP
jgi:formylglycine-generating enzyme required for sulfatase activity